VPDLARRLQDHPAGPVAAPVLGHEHTRGYGIMALPFASGHVLGLRVFPENDFGPYVSVWVRHPGGEWDILVDGPRLDTACPRYFGPAARLAAHARIDVAWTGPATLRVRMDAPSLEWTATMCADRRLGLANAVGGRLPLWTWRAPALLRFRELIARRLVGLGEVRLSARLPAGQRATLMPGRVYRIAASRAVLAGRDLGPPAPSGDQPSLGGVTFPPVMAVGGSLIRPAGPGGRRE
jgi:hypothetical protein